MRCCQSWAVSLVLIAAVAGCKPTDEVQAYQVPKEGAVPSEPSTPSNVPWIVPSGWVEKPTPQGGMRIASYAVTAPDGRTVDISVVPLGGTPGALLDNVNRWRNQLELGPITEAELGGLRQAVKIGEVDGELYDMVGEKPTLEGRYKSRTLAGILSMGGTTVFFKASGEDALVTENKPKFLTWLKSVQTGPATPASAASAPAPGPAAPDMRGPVAPPPSTDLPQWQVPSGWKPVAASTMRLASFAIEGANGQTGDLSVVALGPQAGGLLANVNRWRGQMGLPPMEESALGGASTRVATAGGDEAVVVDLSGQGAMAGKRVLAAVVARPDRTWFFKLTGDDALVAAQKEPFLAFIKSVKYP